MWNEHVLQQDLHFPVRRPGVPMRESPDVLQENGKALMTRSQEGGSESFLSQGVDSEA
jgi:hypothetical protein